MKWITLYRKIGKQPMKITQHNDVTAVLENPITGQFENIPLELKYRADGSPYFVRQKQPT